MDGVSPLQVCISLIKRRLCASYLPSARFIIQVSRGENKWGGEAGGRTDGLLGYRFMKQLSWAFRGPWTHSCLFAEGALAVCLSWLVPPCLCTTFQHLAHTSNCTSTLSGPSRIPTALNSVSLLISGPPSRSPGMFSQRGKINRRALTSGDRISSHLSRLGRSDRRGVVRKSSTCHCKRCFLGNVYLDFQCHTFLGCYCFSGCAPAEWSLCERGFSISAPSRRCDEPLKQVLHHIEAWEGRLLPEAPRNPRADHHPGTYLA